MNLGRSLAVRIPDTASHRVRSAIPADSGVSWTVSDSAGPNGSVGRGGRVWHAAGQLDWPSCCYGGPWRLVSVSSHVQGDSQQFQSRGFRSGPAQRRPFLYFAHRFRRQVTKHQVRHAVKDLRTACLRQATTTSGLWRRDLRCHVSARRSGAWMTRQRRHSSLTCSCIVRDAGAGIPFATTARALARPSTQTRCCSGSAAASAFMPVKRVPRHGTR